jgi:hypothetical protein
MSDQETKVKPKEARPAAAADEKVWCRRILRSLPIAEHKACSYCFGTEEQIRSGGHERFCDFQEGKDPICFGFPET